MSTTETGITFTGEDVAAVRRVAQLGCTHASRSLSEEPLLVIVDKLTHLMVLGWIYFELEEGVMLPETHTIEDVEAEALRWAAKEVAGNARDLLDDHRRGIGDADPAACESMLEAARRVLAALGADR